MALGPNPRAAGMDPRWPLGCVDMVYVKQEAGAAWVVIDFFGDVIFRGDRSSCFFYIDEAPFFNYQQRH